MKNELESESYKRSTGIAAGDPLSVAKAIAYLDSIWVLAIGEQRRVVADMWENMIEGITSYSCTTDNFVGLREKLTSVSDRLDLGTYVNIFSLMHRYDDIPDQSAHDLALRNAIDTNLKARVIVLGSKIKRLQEEEFPFSEKIKQSMLKTADKALKFALRHGGPDTKIVAREALEMDKSLDVSNLVQDSKEDKNCYVRAMSNYNFFQKRYPHEALPKRFIVDAAYESLEAVFSRNPAKGKDFDFMVAVRQLESLLDSSRDWCSALFPDETDLDYENKMERDIILNDLQNGLLYVVQKGNDDSLRKEAAETLAKKGDDRISALFNKMIADKAEGSDFITKFTVPKPTKEAKKLIPHKSAPKKAVK